MKAALPQDEPARLAALERYDILDTPAEAGFDALAQLAADLCDTPIALVTLVDRDRQWFKARVGLAASQTPREVAVCAHALLQEELMLVPDTLADPRFADNPLVHAEPHMRFYCGALLRTPDGHRLGTLCVLDYRPRTLEPHQQRGLRTLAAQVMTQIELRRLLRQEQRVRDALQVANRRRDEFLAVLAHQLRNPLAPISTALEVLRRAGGQDTTTKWAGDVIRRQTEQLARIVDSLRDAARVAQDELSVTLQCVALAEIVQRAVAAVRAAIDERRQTLTLTVPEPGVLVQADPARLTQALANLVDNASKFTPRGGHVHIEARCQARDATVRVADNGAGIAADDLPRIFELFVQVDQAIARTASGIGVGLAVARKIIEMHGGSIAAASEGPGRGSEFVVRLPVVSGGG